MAHFGKLSASTCQLGASTFYITSMWLVYMLLCDQKTFYIGISDDFPNRFKQHKNKLVISAKQFSYHRFVYAERYISKYEAAKKEKQLKGWSHAKKQMLVDGK